MSENIASVGVKFDGTDLEKGKATLDSIAVAGPKVEAALKGVEGAAGKTGKTLGSLGDGSGKGLKDIAGHADKAAQGLGKTRTAAESAGASMRGLAVGTDALQRLGGAATTTASGIKNLGGASSAAEAGMRAFVASLGGASQALAAEVARMREAQAAATGLAAAHAAVTKQMEAFNQSLSGGADALKMKQQAMANSDKAMNSLAGSARLVTSAFAAIGVSASVGEFIKMADASTNVASRLGLVTSSATELIAVQQKLFVIAQSSRVSFVDLAGTYAQMARSTRELGISQDAMLGVTKTISQALTISGSSATSAQAALAQLSQGFASGTLRGEELNSVIEQTPRLAQAIADGFGISIGKLREMGQAGQLTAETVVSALQKSAGKVESEFERMATTVEQASTRAGNSMTRMVGAINNVTGATKFMAEGISRVSTVMDVLSNTFDKIGSQAPLREAASEVVRLDAAAARLRAGMANGVFGPNAQRELERINAELALAKQRFRDLDSQLGGSGKNPRDQSGFPSRSSSYEKEDKRQKALATDLNDYRLKRDNVPASYVKDMEQIIRLNKEGKLVGQEYTRALKEQQDLLAKKERGPGGSGPKPKTQRDTSTQDAAAQTKLDIEAVRTGAAALTDIYTSSEKIMEASRRAGLIDEREYFEAKRAFLDLNTRAQTDALEAENARLNQQKLNTKEALDRDRQVMANQAKIAKLQQAQGAANAVADINQSAEARSRDFAATQSQEAAQRNLNETLEQYRRTLGAIGSGRAEQERTSGINQIADKYAADQRRLEDARRTAQFGGNWSEGAQKQYDEELARIETFKGKALSSYQDYYDQLKAKQGDWQLGAQSAMRNYADESSNVFAQAEGAVTSAFKGMEDALVSFAMTGKMDFKSLANSIIADLIRMQIRAAAVSFLSGMGFSGGGAVGPAPAPGFASGGYTGAGSKYQPAGIVHAGEYVINAESTSKLGLGYLDRLNGYAQGGLVAPLPRMAAMPSGGGGAVKVEIINNGAPAQATATQQTQPDGSSLIRIVLQAVAEDMSSGGMTARATAGRFGLATN